MILSKSPNQIFDTSRSIQIEPELNSQFTIDVDQR